MASLYSLYKHKEAGLLGERTCMRAAIDSEFLVRRLSKSQVLKGHNGCVNTVAWNESGTRILSGSDDCHLKIYDAGSGLIHKSVHTTHRSNIFSAKFLPGCCDLRTVSCAGIGSVEYSEFTPDGEYIGHPFHCQNSITYQVATTPSDPNEFLTCEERGNVRLYDLRVRSSCCCEGCKRDVLYSFPASVTSIAVHPLSPSYIAFALGDGSVRLLDRRMTTDLIGKIDLPDLADRSTVKHYKPYSIGTQPHKITSTQFNSVGSELLVSYSEDYVYLFNNRLFHIGPVSHDPATRNSSAFLSKPIYLSQIESYSPSHRRKRSSFVKRKPPSNYDNSPPTSLSKPAPTTDSVPPAKKLRLRGDWSDTGPEARPDVNSEGGGGRERGHLMNRMSRMFAQWIDMSLSPGSNNESSPDREDVPGRYRHRRSRRVPPPPTSHDGASPSTSSATSSNDSFQLFDSDSNEIEVEEVGERGEGESRDHLATLDSNEDLFPLVVESPNGSTTKSEGIATMDVSTVSERPRTPTQATGDLKDDEISLSLSSIEHQTASEKSDDKADTSSVVDSEPRFTSSDGEGEKSSDSKKSKHSFRTHKLNDTSSPTHEDGGAQSTSLEDSTASSMAAVMIENRTKNSSPDSAPAVVVEGETDSDDTYEEGGSYDESHDCLKGSHDDNDDGLLYSQYFMRYKGHRNSRTMIKQANFWGENWVLSGSDCGRVFIWDKWSGRVINMLMADSHVVNCVQPHPSAYVLATSGIDYDVKLWEPLAAESTSLGNLQEVVDRNEVMLEESRNTITVPSMFVFRILAYLHRRRRMQHGHDEPADEESD